MSWSVGWFFVWLFGFAFVADWIMLIRRASFRASSSAMFALGALVACLASLPRSSCFSCSVWTPSYLFHSLQRLLAVVVFLVVLGFLLVLCFAWFGLVSPFCLCFACLQQSRREEKKTTIIFSNAIVSHKNLLSNNITKFASSTARHQSYSCRKCDHMFGKKGVLVVLLTWIVDRDYMSIPRCYDIPKKLLSNYDCNKISHGRVHQNLCVFFCSRNCCLCAVHQSVKELRHAKKQRESGNKQPKTGKQTNKPNQKTQTKQTKNTRNTTPKQNPLQRVKQVKRVRRNPHRWKTGHEAHKQGKLWCPTIENVRGAMDSKTIATDGQDPVTDHPSEPLCGSVNMIWGKRSSPPNSQFDYALRLKSKV